MTRREWLQISGSALWLGAQAHGSEPENLSYPLATLQSAITPPERFFVRDHFSPPEVPLRNWRLRIEGLVENPFELSYSDLVELPSATREALLECAGNNANGSAVSNGVWEGVPMAALLERARPKGVAAFVLLEGVDTGRLFEHNPSALPYTQKVPLTRALQTSSLIAYQLNGRALPARNGFPARALFPGCYGMDSVKWLRRITLIGAEERETAFERGGFNRVYNRVQASGTVARVASIQVKSAIAWPPPSFKLPAGQYAVWGFAWSGAARIRNVRLSADGGKSWGAAKLETQADPYSWVKWRHEWKAAPGDYALLSRSADEAGNEQPLRRDPNRKDFYELNWCVPLTGSVR